MISASCPAISYSKTDGLPSSVHLLQSSLRFSRRVTVRLLDVKPYAPKAQWSAAVSIDERIKAFTEVLKIVAWPAIIVWLYATSGHKGLGQQLCAIVERKQPEFKNQGYASNIVKVQEALRPIVDAGFQTAKHAAGVIGNAVSHDCV